MIYVVYLGNGYIAVYLVICLTENEYCDTKFKIDIVLFSGEWNGDSVTDREISRSLI